MARKSTKNVEPTKTIAARVTLDRFAQLEEYRWDNRMTMSQLVTVALDEWADANIGTVTPAATEEV